MSNETRPRYQVQVVNENDIEREPGYPGTNDRDEAERLADETYSVIARSGFGSIKAVRVLDRQNGPAHMREASKAVPSALLNVTPTELGRAIAYRVIGGMSVGDIIGELDGPTGQCLGSWEKHQLFDAMVEAHYLVSRAPNGFSDGRASRLKAERFNEVNLVLLGLPRKET